MRWKIITVYSAVVIVLGAFLAELLHVQSKQLFSNENRTVAEASQILSAANTQLQLDALFVERWLTSVSNEPSVREPFEAAARDARAEAATKQANSLADVASQTPALAGLQPAIIAFVDASGVAIGRNGSKLMRGTDLGKSHEKMKDAIASGQSGSEIWYAPSLSEQWLVSFAPIRNNGREVVGGIIFGTPLDDERVTRTTSKTSGGSIVIAVEGQNNIEVVAKSNSVDADAVRALSEGTLSRSVSGAFGANTAQRLDGGPKSLVFVGAPLNGYGGTNALLIAVAPASAVDASFIYFSIAAMIALGLVIVAWTGWLLGSYISKPVEELEEGLLQILNGRSDYRFEIEHAVLGGVVFRINTLLNQLMDVQEDMPESNGASSQPRPFYSLHTALKLDEPASQPSQRNDPASAAALAAEPEDQYYRRLYREYLDAKKSVGDPVENITQEAFFQRIRQRESDAVARSGRPVRYQVQVRNNEVMLLAVEIAFPR